MSRIFDLQDARHKQVQDLLPWHANGTLGPAETATVEKHLAECEECRDDLEHERALRREVARLPLDVEHGWEGMQAKLEGRKAAVPLLRRRVPLGWALAVQAACLAVVVIGALTLLPAPDKTYRALGAATSPANGNIIVVFKPDASEAALRRALRQVDARLVDGPTTTDAYLLHVDAARRADAVTRLRANGDVTLAEPIDGGSRP